MAKVWVNFCFLLQVVDLEVRTHFLFVWYFCTSLQLLLLTPSINPGRNGYDQTQTLPGIWYYSCLDADCCWCTAEKLMLLGAKAEQANTATKNPGAEQVGRQNGSLRSERAHQAASFCEPGS